jgi:uncharacterized protein (DUF983 family)
MVEGIMIWDILMLRCPHCKKGSIKGGLFSTAKHCPVCGKELGGESGFFVGAIYPLYGMAGLVGGVTALTCLFALDLNTTDSVFAGIAVAALLAPYLFWLSRAAFLHAEQRFFKRMGN